MKNEEGEGSSISILNIVELLVVIAISFIFGAVAFYRVLGILGVVHGLVMTWRRRIPVGFEGQTPSFYIEGIYAIIVGTIAVAGFAALAWFAPEMACHFSHGGDCKYVGI